MKLETTAHSDALLIKVVEDRIDAASCIQFKDEMQAATVNAPARVILDMGQVKFLDSSGLGAVVAVMKACAPDTQLELASLTPIVAKVFRLTRMDEVFAIHASAALALTA